MTLLALVFASAIAQPTPTTWRASPWVTPAIEPPSKAWNPPITWAGRLITYKEIHVGVRSHWLATPDEKALAFTVQVSVPGL